MDLAAIRYILSTLDKNILLTLILVSLFGFAYLIRKIKIIYKDRKAELDVIASYIFFSLAFIFISLQIYFEHFSNNYLIAKFLYILAISSLVGFITYGKLKYVYALMMIAIGSVYLLLSSIFGNSFIFIYMIIFFFVAFALAFLGVSFFMYLAIKRYPPLAYFLGSLAYVIIFALENIVISPEHVLAPYFYTVSYFIDKLGAYVYLYVIAFLLSSVLFTEETNAIRGLTRTFTIYIGISGIGVALYTIIIKINFISGVSPVETLLINLSAVSVSLLILGLIFAASILSTITSTFIQKYASLKDIPSLLMGFSYFIIALALVSYIYAILLSLGYLLTSGLIAVVLTYEIPYRLYLALLLIAFTTMTVASLMIIRKELYASIFSFIAGFGIALVLIAPRLSLNLVFQLLNGDTYILGFITSLLAIGLIPIVIFIRYGLLLFRQKSKASLITLGIGVSMLFFLMSAFSSQFLLDAYSRIILAVIYLLGSVLIYRLIKP